jgi:hypothetical protein
MGHVGAKAHGEAIDEVLISFKGNIVDAKYILSIRWNRDQEQWIRIQVIVALRNIPPRRIQQIKFRIQFMAQPL